MAHTVAAAAGVLDLDIGLFEGFGFCCRPCYRGFDTIHKMMLACTPARDAAVTADIMKSCKGKLLHTTAGDQLVGMTRVTARSVHILYCK